MGFEEKTNRRIVLRLLTLIGAGLGWREVAAQPSTKNPQIYDLQIYDFQIADLADFANEFDFVTFDYLGIKSLVVRLPAPRQPQSNILKIDRQFYLTAFKLICTHFGCEPATPNANHLLVCPCHLNAFNADGSSLGVLTTEPLENIKLEVRLGKVYAVGSS
jgi:Rieske Fe-S protein